MPDQIAEDHGISIVEMETDKDYIHLLIDCKPQHYIPNIVKAIERGIGLIAQTPSGNSKVGYGVAICGIPVILLPLPVKIPNNKSGNISEARKRNEVREVLRHKAYRFRIYPNQEQEVLISKTIGCARFVYNHFLDLWNRCMLKRGKDGLIPNAPPCFRG